MCRRRNATHSEQALKDGILQIEQCTTRRPSRALSSLAGSSQKHKGKTERNDRVFAVPRDSGADALGLIVETAREALAKATEFLDEGSTGR